MCRKAVFWALKQTGLRPMVKLVLIYLADHANEAGECWPSFATLAQEVGITRRAAIQAVTALETAGLVNRYHRQDAAGDAASNRYRLRFPGEVVNAIHPGSEADSLEVVNDVHHGGEAVSPGVVNDVHPNLPIPESNSGNRKNTPLPPTPVEPEPSKATVTLLPAAKSKRVPPRHCRFEEFWAVWPDGYRKGKKPSREKWEAQGLDALADRIIADVVRRKRDDDGWRRGYVPHPKTYLNQELWNDDIRPAPRAETPRYETAEERRKRELREWAQQQSLLPEEPRHATG